jgi:formiminoglutamase
MSGESSSADELLSRLEPARLPEDLPWRPEDRRVGEIIDTWKGDLAALKPGRAVLVGFPQDEGVRRNHGRPGAAEAPDQIRSRLCRLTTWDLANQVDLEDHRPLDMGNLRITGDLEESQQSLKEVVGAILRQGAVPIVLGGGHETAYGHYLGYVASQSRKSVAIINIDAHLDVRPCIEGLGHSGSPFRQAMEHLTCPLPGHCYVCLGAQPHSVSRGHFKYARSQGCTILWADQLRRSLVRKFMAFRNLFGKRGRRIYLSIDADVVQASEVPGVSAPNPTGLPGEKVIACAQVAGASPEVSSFELVEINPHFDRDGISARWAAVVIWNFLIGLALRAPVTSTPQ